MEAGWGEVGWEAEKVAAARAVVKGEVARGVE